jgi:hypothetical protein
MSYDHWKTTNPADEFLGQEVQILPGHASFCCWDLYIDGEWIERFDSYRAAENAADDIGSKEDTEPRKLIERLACGCFGKCDPYAHDTAPDWDGTPDGPDYIRCAQCDGKIYEGETHKCE